MHPKIILHNSLSLDGSLTGFEPNMELHYRIAGMFKPEVHLIGSNTITAGIELYGTGVPPEKPSDFQKPKRNKKLPSWVIIDSKGKLQGLLHTCRQFEQVREVILLVSQTTPKRYLRYLDERQYEYHIVGKDSVDLSEALALLAKTYQVKTIVTDTGRILGNLLLNQGLVDEISLLVHPVIVGKTAYPMFSDINKNLDGTLVKCEQLEKHYIWLLYKI
ncbi:MAG: 5-amino-6-(5-phosphoribosylamino)uracil reductase [Thermoplasmatales archaeon]|jgi:2,5-diamino-6-(ribosylamino)-4(3H)-pyrimidinone 5'-phosphate reductase|nr:5-amino-6-(5-phosphoribosylamino)uracil reductase [Thermoplasmatales archaeon]